MPKKTKLSWINIGCFVSKRTKEARKVSLKIFNFHCRFFDTMQSYFRNSEANIVIPNCDLRNL